MSTFSSLKIFMIFSSPLVIKLPNMLSVYTSPASEFCFLLSSPPLYPSLYVEQMVICIELEAPRVIRFKKKACLHRICIYYISPETIYVINNTYFTYYMCLYCFYILHRSLYIMYYMHIIYNIKKDIYVSLGTNILMSSKASIWVVESLEEI